MNRTIFHLDMDSFFASCEQQADPRLRGRPIAVSGDPKSRTVVAAASKEAKQWGVKSGMTIRDARALCPHIQFVLGDPDKYVDVSRRVMAILRSYTEDMEIFSIDEAFLDVGGAVKQRACVGEGFIPSRSVRQGIKPCPTTCGAISLALDMKRRIRAEVGECVTCSIGIASNKRLAKLASEYRKPDGLVVVGDAEVRAPDRPSFRPSKSASARRNPVACTNEISRLADSLEMTNVGILSVSDLLSSLKLRDLCGIGARIEARLHDLGIWTVSGLAAAPVAILTKEFGVYGVELHDMAHGRDASPVVAGDADPKSVGHATTLPRDIHTLNEARPVIAELAEKVAARLRRYGFRGATVHLTVRFRDFSGTSEQRFIGAPTDDGLLIAREAMEMIDVWCRGGFYTLPDGRQGVKPCPTLPHHLRLLGISVSSLTPRNPWQQPIFPKSQHWAAATQALDAVNDRYGDWTLQRAVLLNPPPLQEGEPPAPQSPEDDVGEGVRRKPECYLRKAAAAFRATRHLRDEEGGRSA